METAPNNNDITKEEQLQREKEWSEVENLVMTYQAQFRITTSEQKKISDAAGNELIKRFSPLFKKYMMLLKTGQIDFNDKEMKFFVCSFMDEPRLQKALKRKKQKAEYRTSIYQKFNFIKETYGMIPEEEMEMDLHMIFLTIVKRYKQMGRNFCAYLYNCYRHEVSRHIKKFTKNPLNIAYKNLEYEDCINGTSEDLIVENRYEDTMYEDNTGLPDLTWISGKNCSEIFSKLTPLDRKILIKYYLEDWNDRQIAEEFGIHINTVNQKRRFAINKIAHELKIEKEDIKRNRKSGKKAVMPLKD